MFVVKNTDMAEDPLQYKVYNIEDRFNSFLLYRKKQGDDMACLVYTVEVYLII